MCGLYGCRGEWEKSLFQWYRNSVGCRYDLFWEWEQLQIKVDRKATKYRNICNICECHPSAIFKSPFGLLLILDAYSVQINNAKLQYITILLGTRLKMSCLSETSDCFVGRPIKTTYSESVSMLVSLLYSHPLKLSAVTALPATNSKALFWLCTSVIFDW